MTKHKMTNEIIIARLDGKMFAAARSAETGGAWRAVHMLYQEKQKVAPYTLPPLETGVPDEGELEELEAGWGPDDPDKMSFKGEWLIGFEPNGEDDNGNTIYDMWIGGPDRSKFN